MFHIVLYEPEIPPNTGNIMRLAANTGSRLHLIHPLGFDTDEKTLRRAGLDYRDQATVTEHASLDAFRDAVRPMRLIALSSKAEGRLHDLTLQAGDAFLFGPETRGLPEALRQPPGVDVCATLPMYPGNRSLNLANSVAVTIYEAWHQNGFGTVLSEQ